MKPQPTKEEIMKEWDDKFGYGKITPNYEIDNQTFTGAQIREYMNILREKTETFLSSSLDAYGEKMKLEERKRLSDGVEKMKVDIPTKLIHLKEKGLKNTGRRNARKKAEIQNQILSDVMSLINNPESR